MTDKEIIERRAELEKQVTHARKAFTTAGGERNRAINELAEAKAAHVDAMVEQAKGILGVDVEAAAKRETDAAAAIETTKVRVTAAHRAREVSEAELKIHLADNFDVFAKHALKLSKHAEEALRRMNAGIAEAEPIWRRAQEAWAPLCRALGGEGRPEVKGVPPFPLARATIPARPPSVAHEPEESEAA